MANYISDNKLIDLTDVPLDELTCDQHEASLFTALDNIITSSPSFAAAGGFSAII